MREGGGPVRRWVPWLVLLGLGACAAPRPGLRGPEPLPVRVEVEVTSEVPDPYVVLSGPVEAYRRIPVAGLLTRALERYARAVGRPDAGKVVRVRVHLVEVSTGYDEVGARRPPARVRLAYAGDPGWIPGPGEDLERDGDLPVPLEIHKSVRLTARVRVAAAGGPPLEQPVSVDVAEVVYQEDFDRWSYDYGPLFRQAVRRLVERVDDIVRRAAGGG